MTDYIPHFTLMTSFLSRVNDHRNNLTMHKIMPRSRIFAPWWWNTVDYLHNANFMEHLWQDCLVVWVFA